MASAVALTGLPYLSRPFRRLVTTAVVLAAVCAVVGGYGFPLNVVAALVLGWGTAAGCHLALGAPNGLPSADEVAAAVRELGIDVFGLHALDDQQWGVEAFTGRDADDRPLELSVYGRDASDAQWLSKLWRFVVYRDSGPTLMFNRLGQVEHEAYLTFLAGHAGVAVPDVVAAGRCGPSNDAALVTRLPEGPRLADLTAEEVSDPDIDAYFESVLLLRRARIAHGALSPATVLMTGRARCCATSDAPRPQRLPPARTRTSPPPWPRWPWWPESSARCGR